MAASGDTWLPGGVGTGAVSQVPAKTGSEEFRHCIRIQPSHGGWLDGIDFCGGLYGGGGRSRLVGNRG